MNERRSAVQIEAYDPSGAIERVARHAPRLADLGGKTIGELTNGLWEDFRVLPALREQLQARYPTAKFIPYTAFPGFYGNDPEVVARAVADRGCDAVIVGNAA